MSIFKQRFFLFGIVMLLAFGSGVSWSQDVIVDGADPDDDGDNIFTTLQAAVDYTIANSMTLIEVQTNGPLGGFSILGAIPVTELTVRAGNGFNPNVTSTIQLLSTTPHNHIVIDGIDSIYNGDHHFDVTGNVTVKNCTVEDTGNNASFSAFYGQFGPAGVYGQFTPNTTLTLLNVDVKASICIDTYTYDNLVVDKSTLDCSTNGFACIASFDRGAAEPFANVELKNSVFISSTDITGSGGDASIRHPAYASGGTMAGDFSATNCIFIGGGGIYLSPNVYVSVSGSTVFNHCTFKSLPGVTEAAAIDLGIAPMNVNINNCLFDMPLAAICVGSVYSNDTVTGTHNLYNITDPKATNYDWATGVLAPFEGESNMIMGTGAAFMTDETGHLLSESTLAMNAGSILTPPITTDIDGENRPSPAGTKPDIGADEELLVPVTLSEFSLE